MSVWLTSDLHLGHERISELAGRPFASVDEMNRTLVELWNERVMPDDDCFVLGDICMGKIRDSLEVVRQLNGRKHLVPGNHDRVSTLYHQSEDKRRAWMGEYAAVGLRLMAPYVPEFELVPGLLVDLCHFPYTGDSHDEDRFAEARPVDEGRWLVHGHTHQSEVVSGERQLHCGVDAWGFAPVPAEMLAGVIESFS